MKTIHPKKAVQLAKPEIEKRLKMVSRANLIKEFQEEYDYLCRYISSISPKLKKSEEMRQRRTVVKAILKYLGMQINKKRLGARGIFPQKP